MATLAKVQTNLKRIKLVEKYAALRKQLKETQRSPKASQADKDKAAKQLDALPRNSSRIRVRNRCDVTGRPRGFLRKFRMSRLSLRHYGHRGDIPGLIKSSW